jgi:hypothetical protein
VLVVLVVRLKQCRRELTELIQSSQPLHLTAVAVAGHVVVSPTQSMERMVALVVEVV